MSSPVENNLPSWMTQVSEQNSGNSGNVPGWLVSGATPAPATGNTTPETDPENPKWKQYVNTDTIVAGTAAAAGIASLFQKSPDKQRTIAVCGRKPLFGQGKKERYRACVANLVYGVSPSAGRQSQLPATPTGMSTGAKIGIIAGIMVFIILIIVLIIYLRNHGAKK